MLFLAYHFTASTTVFALYCKPSSLLPISAGEAALCFILLIMMAVLFNRRPNHFGQYKSAFKPDPYSQHHYLLLLVGRVLLPVVVIVAGDMLYSGFIAAALPLTTVIVLAVKRPYLHAYNNVRAVINEVTVAVCLGVYGYHRAFVFDGEQFSTGINSLLPYVVVGMLLLS